MNLNNVCFLFIFVYIYIYIYILHDVLWFWMILNNCITFSSVFLSVSSVFFLFSFVSVGKHCHILCIRVVGKEWWGLAILRKIVWPFLNSADVFCWWFPEVLQILSYAEYLEYDEQLKVNTISLKTIFGMEIRDVRIESKMEKSCWQKLISVFTWKSFFTWKRSDLDRTWLRSYRDWFWGSCFYRFE